MKRIYLVLVGVDQPDPTFIAGGIWLQVDQNDKVWLIVQNQTPNQGQRDDWGGFNAIDPDADTYSFPTGFSVSTQEAVNFADEFAETPPRGVLRQYKTLAQCCDAIWNATDVQGIMLFDNN